MNSKYFLTAARAISLKNNSTDVRLNEIA